MMYGEFVERTGVYVSIDEFNTIVEVYNNSDVDKDEFCPLGHYVNTLDNSINEYWEKTAEKHI